MGKGDWCEDSEEHCKEKSWDHSETAQLRPWEEKREVSDTLKKDKNSITLLKYRWSHNNKLEQGVKRSHIDQFI